jgi:predicted HAD superfamily phosphohydrolase
VAVPAAKKTVKASGRWWGVRAGSCALRQYKARTGSAAAIPRSHIEELAGAGVGSDASEGTSVKLGVWIPNTESRRAKLTQEQLAQLAGLGLDWA